MDFKKLNDQEIVRREKLNKLIELGKSPYKVEKVDVTFSLSDVISRGLEITQSFCCAGRVLLIRRTFFVLSENGKRLQAYINIKEDQGKELFKYFDEFVDIGDYLSISGNLFTTKTGELTVNVSSLQIISKSLKPLPEKRVGITNPELMMRNRVGALLVNNDLLEDLGWRSKIIFELRNYLNSLGYLEFETPILHKIAGGAVAKPFKTFHNSLKEELFLRIATELHLKRLIVSGFTKVFEIGKSFRNEGIDSTHNPEFTSIEIYTTYLDMELTMDLTENIILHLNKLISERTAGEERQRGISSLTFERKAIWELLQEKLNVDFLNNPPSLEEMLKLASKWNIHLEEHEKNWSSIYEKLFEDLISPELKNPTFVYGFSSELSPLAKKDFSNERFARRFELYMDGVELANGFSEQNDPEEQLNQFKLQASRETSQGGVDYDYISCLEYGLPPTGGVGIGLDRLIMFLLNRQSIKEIIAFPHLKG
ncbi:lysine--tRNA ligase [Mycoplasma suis]|uniref:Lysine--tRNA ligase n=2 Tax=Mycoplasma suis TaxID=57372 RepID=F0QQW5_MYCSL|nr:lysine--tRNA ligase [Mycoplasma suis]ADX97885.1 lysyl-tRNA synthetase [Mycoplasma suis str. Illinois]CBZ40385.1 Lysyl-tRNA synthetase [Mycoplasma suis KI3806]